MSNTNLPVNATLAAMRAARMAQAHIDTVGALAEQRAELLAALTRCADRLSVVIECDNEDHGGASADDLAAYEAARAALAKAGAL